MQKRTKRRAGGAKKVRKKGEVRRRHWRAGCYQNCSPAMSGRFEWVIGRQEENQKEGDESKMID